ncbi:ISKra4 family transposase, partial [Acrocarpospora corrugata]|uniref:ISKra4 family transposase n=1 Tax=Acrocarpospora corrugata TaxID=35763 RepID=UPI0012D32AAB
MSGYAVPEELAGFERSWARFAGLLTALSDPVAGPRTHADVEEYLLAEGREVMRQVTQDRLDHLAADEGRRTRVLDAGGVAHTRVERGHARQLVTVFGPVTVRRMAYRAPGTANLYPLDQRLNLPVETHSHTLRKLAALEAARGSFDGAVTAIAQATGQIVGKRQRLALARLAARDIAAFYDARRPDPAGTDRLMVLSFDGKGVVMRPEALRKATALAAANGERKLVTRLSPGEKNGRKRMAELAVVYDALPVTRAAADVISRTPARPASEAEDATGLKESAGRRRGPKAVGKWLTASLIRDIPAVVAAGFDEAERRDPAHERIWVVLVDGNRTQIDAIKAEATRREITVYIVLDFVHVLEYIWRAGWSFFDVGDPAAEQWVAEQAIKVLDGKAAQVATGIRRRATRF